jgi:hypothetical protein
VQDNGGLYVKARTDDFGARHSRCAPDEATRRVKQFSFSYDVINEQRSKDNQSNELLDVFLHEVGPTPLGMNPLTELIAAKHQIPPEPDDPVPSEQPDSKRRAPSALFLRLRSEIAAWDLATD